MASLGVAWQQAVSAQTIAQARFAQEANAFSAALAERIALHTEILRGLRALLIAHPALNRAEFERVATELDMARRYPEVHAIAFMRRVSADEWPTHDVRIRAHTLQAADDPQDVIHPRGVHSEYMMVKYVWPPQASQDILGLDIGSQPWTVKAHQRNATVVLGALHEQGSYANFVIRVPIWGLPSDVRPASNGTPAMPFIGAMAATIGLKELIGTLQAQGYAQGMSIAIYDSDLARSRGISGQSLRALLLPTFSPSVDPLQNAQPLVRDMRVHDHSWRLTFHTDRPLLSAAERHMPWITGLAGGVVTLLLAAWVTQLRRQRFLAHSHARICDDARHNSETRFHALFHHGSAGVAQVDANTGRFIRTNRRYADILGRTPAEMEALYFLDTSDPANMVEDLIQVERIKSGELAQFQAERHLMHKDGHGVWVELTLAPLWAPGSAPHFLVAVVHDITARKQMQAALDHHEQRLCNILQNLPVGLCLIQADGRMAFRNERFIQICGYTETDVPTAEIWWEVAYPDAEYRERTRAGWMDARAAVRQVGGKVAASKEVIFCKDGKIRSVEIAGVFMGAEYLMTLVDLTHPHAISLAHDQRCL